MGHYISLWLRFDQPNCESDLLRGAFECDFFYPQALGALGNKAPKTGHSKWFLGGWGLEHFVTTYAGYAKSVRNHEFVFPTSRVDDDSEYLSSISNNIRRGVRLTTELSPFEQLDEDVGVTFLTSTGLQEETLPDYMAGLSDMTQRIVELCGSFHVATRNPTKRDWTSAYRFTYKSEPTSFIPLGTPFVTLTARADPSEPHVTQLTIFSEATIWLQGVNSLGGQILPAEADTNLIRLQDLVETIVESADVGLQSADLSIEGKLFLREEKRIKEAFSRVLGK